MMFLTFIRIIIPTYGDDGDDTFNIIGSLSGVTINGGTGTNTVTGEVGSNTTINVVGANSGVSFSGKRR